MIQALITSIIAYGIPNVDMKNSQWININTTIRKGHMIAMGLSPSTSTNKLPKMGVHNTSEELVEVHNVRHPWLERLKPTNTGRAQLQDLGYQVEDDMHVSLQRIPHEIRNNMLKTCIPSTTREEDRLRYNGSSKH